MSLPHSIQYACFFRPQRNFWHTMLFLLTALVVSEIQCAAQQPHWIWFHKTQGAETRYFRKRVQLESAPSKAELIATADDEFEAYINGEKVAQGNSWQEAVKADVTAKLKPGVNVIGFKARNGDSSAAGLAARLTLQTGSDSRTIVTDSSWKAAVAESANWKMNSFDDASWLGVSSVGLMGTEPWGNVFGSGNVRATTAAAAPKREATPADALFVADGFKVERIHSGDPEEGSWVAITKDHLGRLILSPQWGKPQSAEEAASRGLLRITLDSNGKVAKREFIARPLYDAQGLLVVGKDLYAVVNKYSTSFESGLYRIRDTRGDDSYSDIQLLKKLPGGGEHGPHAVVLSPDKKGLYVLAGNHTKLPEGIIQSPMPNYAEDHVLPRQWDGNGHAAGILAPGGYVATTDFDGKNWNLFCSGFRNPYDIAFNAEGELFTFDADMEWDWGMPWYRATRVNHCVSGGEYGWRSGTGKWPDYYPDSLGAIDIGIGCPTGIEFGTGAKFPARYQRALFIMDWTYGRLMAVHMKPDGSGYQGSYENFVCPLGLMKPGERKAPLNVTDLVIGNDGAMYFTVGGRNTQSGLYRVTYTGRESTAAVAPESGTQSSEARKLRKRIESYHGKADATAMDLIWSNLSSNDRNLRYAARVALESQPVAMWQARAIAETQERAALAALLALARTGPKDAQEGLLKALGKFPLPSLSEELQLEKLRVIQLSLIRQGRPGPELVRMAIEKLDSRYPSSSERLNRELSQILIHLEAPTAVSKTMALMRNARTQEDAMHYLFHLRTAKNWTLEERKEYFGFYGREWSASQHPDQILKWFEEAGRPFGNGASFNNFLKNFRNEAVTNLTAVEKKELAPMLEQFATTAPTQGRSRSAFPNPRQREFFKEWKTSDLVNDLDQVSSKRNFNRGRQAFVDAQCLACHKFGNEGGGVGPDLTAVASRFGRRDLLDSVLEPSRVVSEQFQNSTVLLKNGDEVTGRLVDETSDKIALVVNPFTTDRVEFKKQEIQSRNASKLSPMPEGLANILTKDELLDLIAFLESGGNPSHPAFAR